MSILNGPIHADVIRDEDMPYGMLLQQVNEFSLSGCFDVAVDEQARYAFVAHEGALSIYELSNPAQPVRLSTLEGLGASRQIAVQDSYAYITARADGLFIIDVHDVTRPRLVAHFDTLELATGVAVSGNLCLVANRHLGVEFIDVSNPAEPVFITSVLAGEAQSVCMDGNFVYVGDWMNRCVQMFDISKVREPVKVSTIMVDGYADGVFARDGYLYVATGHHSAKLKNRRKYYKYTYVTPQMMEDGYGCGHGLEIFDVSKPGQPEYVSSVKFPPLYVAPLDTWLVTVSGHYAYVSDTFNGLFIVDISNIGRPFFAGHFRLPLMDKPRSAAPPSLQQLSYPITGFALANGHLLAAGFHTGLHVLAFDESVPLAAESDRVEIESNVFTIESPHSAHEDLVFFAGGQIHAVDFCGDAAIVAAGNDGLYAVDAEHPGTVLAHSQDAAIVHDAQVMGDWVVTADGQQGVSLYAYDTEHGFVLKDRFGFGSDSARQIVLFPSGSMAAVQLDRTAVGFLRISPEGTLTFINKVSGLGNLYHHHLCRSPLGDKYLGATPLTQGFMWIDMSGEQAVKTSWAIHKQACPIEEGAVIVGDRTILIQKNKYIVAEHPQDVADFDALKAVRVDGALLNGQPFLCGSAILLVNRCLGTVEFIDIRDMHAPKFVKRIRLPGNPEYAVMHKEHYWIACGHGGLIKMR